MDVREAVRRGPMTRFQWSVVAICILLTVIDGYEILVTAFTLPALIKEWDLSELQQAWVASIGTLGMGVGAALLGPLADRIGRRRHIVGSLVLIVVGMSLSGLAPGIATFLAFRFFAGLFLGGIVPSINVLVAEYASDERRGSVMGIYGVGFPLGSATGGFLSLWLIGSFGWRGPFFFSAIVTAVLLAWCVVALPESVGYLVEKRPAGALEAYNAIGAKLGLPPHDALPEPTSSILRPSLRTSMWTGVMLTRTVRLWIGYGLLILAFYFANLYTAKLVAEVTGDANIGIVAQALVSVGGVLGAVLFAGLARRWHPRLVTAGVMVYGAVVYWLFAAFFDNTSLVLVIAVLVGVAANGGVIAYYAISPPIYPTMVRASAVGLMMGFGRVFAVLAPFTAAFMLDAGLSRPALYQIFGVVMLVSGVAAYSLHRTYVGVHALDAMQEEARVAEVRAGAAA